MKNFFAYIFEILNISKIKRTQSNECQLATKELWTKTRTFTSKRANWQHVQHSVNHRSSFISQKSLMLLLSVLFHFKSLILSIFVDFSYVINPSFMSCVIHSLILLHSLLKVVNSNLINFCKICVTFNRFLFHSFIKRFFSCCLLFFFNYLTNTIFFLHLELFFSYCFMILDSICFILC